MDLITIEFLIAFAMLTICIANILAIAVREIATELYYFRKQLRRSRR